jgi:excisionase family DNA binding protein
MARRVGQLEVNGTRQAVSRKHRVHTPPDATSDDVGERLLDVREAATLLGLKPATLYQWAYKRRIPIVKLFGPRGALRFRLHDVQKLIQDSLRPAVLPSEPSE